MKNKAFGFAHIYSLIRKKHPNWTHKQLSRCTAYALRKRGRLR